VGLWDDRGNYSAATNVFPSAGGPVQEVRFLKEIFGQYLPGTLGSVAVSLGDNCQSALSDAYCSSCR
jgi:hypothetical protein